jgi:hypothetical protein
MNNAKLNLWSKGLTQPNFTIITQSLKSLQTSIYGLKDLPILLTIKKNRKLMQKEIESFNNLYKIGDTIKYKNEHGEIVEGKLRWQAEPDYKGVVWVAGKYDAVPFENVIKEPLI